MKLIRELANQADDAEDDKVEDTEKKSKKKEPAPKDEAPSSTTDSEATPEVDVDEPKLPEDGWNVGHLAHHGILLSCDGFSLKLDLDQLNALFDIAEDGGIGEVRDHAGKLVTVEVEDDRIILSREGDETYPAGVVLDLDTLKEMGIEKHEDQVDEPGKDTQPEASDEEGRPEGEQPGEGAGEQPSGDTIDDEELEGDLAEGIKKAFRRSGNKIKRGFRVTSGWRKGRVVAKASSAFKPRAKAKTRMKLKIAGRKKKIIRLLKAKRTRRKSTSKRLARMNKSVK